jgi:hypothetical protein
MSRVLAGEENRPGKFNDCRRLPGEEGIETASPLLAGFRRPADAETRQSCTTFRWRWVPPLYQILRWTHLSGDALAFLHRTAS